MKTRGRGGREGRGGRSARRSLLFYLCRERERGERERERERDRERQRTDLPHKPVHGIAEILG